MKTKLKSILIVTLLISSLLLLGCTRASGEVYSEYNLKISCAKFEAYHDLTSEIQVTVGDIITVELCSNPTTGFQWEYETTGRTVLQETAHDFVPPGSDEPGTPGKDIWTFEAIEKGETELRMEYSRPWEGGEKGEWTFNLEVHARERS